MTKLNKTKVYMIVTITIMQSICIQSYNFTIQDSRVTEQPVNNDHFESFKSTTCSNDTDCPLWTTCNNNTCICRQIDQRLTAKCENLQLMARKCSCVTYDNQTREFTAGECIEGCSNDTTNNQLYFSIPSDPSEINRFMCEERWNRTGRLCGKCLPGHSPLAYSYDMRCVKCPEGINNIWKYILVAYGPLTVFYLIVLFFKINATSSHLHGFLYYSQAVSVPAFVRVAYIAMVGDATNLFLFHTLTPIYSIWSLDILRSLQLEICLDVSTLTLFAMDYILAMYPLLLTVTSYILIELHDRDYKVMVFLWRPFRCVFTTFCRNWNIRNSVIDAYVTFFLLSFVKVLNISIDILTPSRATDLTSGKSTWVLYYDGTVDYLGTEHLPYAILTIIIGIVMIVAPAILLVLYPFRWFQRLISCLRVKGHILQTVMDSFQGCYKDGTEPGTRDYRWFAAVPIISRSIAFILLSFTLDSSYFPLGSVVVVSGLVLTIIIQPYKNNVAVYAKIDCIFLGFLAITFTMIDGKNIADLLHPSLNQVNDILLGITSSAPIFYMVGITLYWILSRMKKGGRLLNRFRAQRQGYQDIEDGMPDRLINPEHYQGSMLHTPVLNTCDVNNEQDSY
ncbi:uncharacterized protein LOC135338015 [Halichondria panicea]|uniref:uncharacterized protein LOC135338015 n=1 Tax=Halichondria panicea TaxID=6063 RepID=UPI00312BAFC3